MEIPISPEEKKEIDKLFDDFENSQGIFSKEAMTQNVRKKYPKELEERKKEAIKKCDDLTSKCREILKEIESLDISRTLPKDEILQELVNDNDLNSLKYLLEEVVREDSGAISSIKYQIGELNQKLGQKITEIETYYNSLFKPNLDAKGYYELLTDKKKETLFIKEQLIKFKETEIDNLKSSIEKIKNEEN